MRFNKVRSVMTPVLLKNISTHPFHKGLVNGTLPRQVFIEFLRQDELYLAGYEEAFQALARRSKDEHHQKLFIQWADETMDTRINLHQKYLPKSASLSWFQPTPTRITPIPAVANYINFMLAHAHFSSLPVALASLTPCGCLYAFLGLQRNGVKNNPYQLWLDTYSSKSFRSFTISMVQVLEELRHRQNDAIEEKKMEKAIEASIHHERHFWDSVYYSPQHIEQPRLICS
jgi:thiaminase (transcriptional activator TenA)